LQDPHRRARIQRYYDRVLPDLARQVRARGAELIVVNLDLPAGVSPEDRAAFRQLGASASDGGCPSGPAIAHAFGVGRNSPPGTHRPTRRVASRGSRSLSSDLEPYRTRRLRSTAWRIVWAAATDICVASCRRSLASRPSTSFRPRDF